MSESNKPTQNCDQQTTAGRFTREIEKRKHAAVIIAAGLGATLALLCDVISEHEARIGELERMSALVRQIVDAQGALISALRRQIGGDPRDKPL